MQLSVEIKVKLPGGALVTPSHSQQKAIDEFATRLLTSEPDKIVKKTWTPEDDKIIRDVIGNGDKMTTATARVLAPKMGRTEKSIITRAWVIQNKGK